MFPILHPDERLRLQQILLGCIPAQTAFLLGTTVTQKRTSSVFNDMQPTCRYTSHYFILTLVDAQPTPLASIQDQLENRLRQYVSSTVIVLDIDQFNLWLKEGRYFASTVAQKGVPIHRHHHLASPLPGPAQPHDKKSYLKNILLVKEFIAGAELFMLRKQYNLSAFMLHQAAEDALKALLQYTCGLRVNTHNLEKLARFCSLASWKITEILAGHTTSEKQLFEKLRQAYIAARYKEYHIAEEECNALTRKIKALLDVVIAAGDEENNRKQ